MSDAILHHRNPYYMRLYNTHNIRLINISPNIITTVITKGPQPMNKQQPTSLKDDELKPDYSLIPMEALHNTVRALEAGEDKYSRNNYKISDIGWDRRMAAILRHLTAAQEDPNAIDQETGVSHLGCAISTLLIQEWWCINGEWEWAEDEEPQPDGPVEERDYTEPVVFKSGEVSDTISYREWRDVDREPGTLPPQTGCF